MKRGWIIFLSILAVVLIAIGIYAYHVYSILKEIQAVQKDYREKAKSVLTPEQLNLLKAKHKESKGKGKPNSLDTND